MKSPLNPKPRIALVASIAWTLWNYRLSLIQALEAQGYEVILIAAEDDSRARLEAHTRARFIPLRQLSRRSLSVFQNFKSLLEMRAVFRQIRPELLLFFTIRPNTLGNLAAALNGIPSISTIEGMGISGSRQGWLRRLTHTLYRLAFRHASKVVFLNQDDLQDFVRQKIIQPAKACLIHGPGVDAQHFAPRIKTRPSEKLIFLFVGRLLAEKGIREYAAAAQFLQSKGVEAEFQVLGDIDLGNPTSISSAELAEWIQAGIIQHLGFQEDVRPVIAESDVLVLPSYYKEGLPRSVLEAMSMQKPIITTDNVGCRDTVAPGKNGYLIPARQVEALAEAMEKMLSLSPAQRIEMGQKSRQMIENEFGDHWVIPQYLALVAEVLRPKV